MKRIIAVVLSAFFILQFFCGITVSASEFSEGNYKGLFDYFISDDEVTIIKINSSLTSLTIPSKIEGYPVTSIAAEAGQYSKLTSVKFPNTLKLIDDSAFKYSKLTEINIPASVETIGDNAFEFNYGVKSITLPEGLRSIGERAFNQCNLFSSITIPSTVDYIGKSAFELYFNDIKIIIKSMKIDIGYMLFGNGSSIYAYENSDAALYAVKNGVKFTSLGKFTGVQSYHYNIYGYKNSKLVSGKKTFDGKLYYFDKSGKARKGFVKMKSGDIYYFSKKTKNLGQAVTGWVKKDGKKYYFQTSGKDKYKAAKGWMKIKGKRYYFNSDGTMATGKTTIKGKTYTFGKDGILKK